MNEAIMYTRNLRKQYGDVAALTGLDLAVPPNLVYGLLGPNGAGKSTTVRILSTLTRPSGGQASVGGFDVAREPEEVRKIIGLTGQDATLDDKLTARENLRIFGRLSRLGKRGARQRADELLERFGLAHAGDRLVGTYSGGMRRRLDLIASLLRAPAVLFLDEPTTGLDVRSRMEIWDTVRDLVADGTTVLLTSQYLEEVDQLATAVGVIDHGRLIAEGSPAQLKSRIGSHIDVVVESTDQLLTVMALLERLTGHRPKADGTHIAVAATDPVPTLPQIVRELDASGAVIRDVGIREPSLDDVFLSLTGTSITPEPVAAEVVGA
ncbi:MULTISPECIES: ATP-binding cassette domain-containing protein [Micromonospora]|uniref:ABC-2 type transport system ATP-binding protein n=1 Tax=Micromonospora yangpuensis TaxID=683228 RepID=A0A1C6UEP9_9ACTN|nr:ATP-binding cassette domain-containing protein [Micromonospora yangpuensis]GGM06163.1 daunorubicin resistance protein DrrA family ABC transporter ATP-binding protein [Micromonospora yangpuensis]SCL52527.1 ABC-2 type transport system ATP-binding protein [Micromonospora yangpuensis]